MSIGQKKCFTGFSGRVNNTVPEASGGAFFWAVALNFVLAVVVGMFFIDAGYLGQLLNPPDPQPQLKRYRIEVPPRVSVEAAVPISEPDMSVENDPDPDGTLDQEIEPPPLTSEAESVSPAAGAVSSGTQTVPAPDRPATAAGGDTEAVTRKDKPQSTPIEAPKPEEPKPLAASDGFEKATVSVAVGIVRRKPSTDAGVAFRLKKGETVTVLETDAQWYRVQDRRNRSGWANQRLFSQDEPVEPPSAGEPDPIRPPSGRITNVDVTAGSMGGDIVSFHIDQDRPPRTMVIEGDSPRIVCDFPEMSIDRSLVSRALGERETVTKIRAGIHGPPEPKVRIVLDLKPSAHYTVRQIYDKANKRYILHILPQKEAPPAG